MQKKLRHYSWLDQALIHLEGGLRTLTVTKAAIRPNPAANIPEAPLSTKQKNHSAGLMRVNHVGEVCAQALYQGQALTARSTPIKTQMQQCAAEEVDHLAWCYERLRELNSHTSYLNPLWYSGALCMGIAAGLAGDQWNLGFVAETERQVTEHLQNHLQRLDHDDKKSLAIVGQMQQDEKQHALAATKAGAKELPMVIKTMMKMAATCMTTTAYWI